MSSVIKRIGGVACACFEFKDTFHGDSGKMRMQLSGTFGDGIDRGTMMLVPLFLSEAELVVIADLWVTEQERELGLPVGESCSSSGWWAGSADASRDQEITDIYDFLIAAALAETRAQTCLRQEIERLYKNQKEIEQELKQEYETGESAWAAQLEVKSEDLEGLIADQEALLQDSQLFTVNKSVIYNGRVYTMSGMEHNVVLLRGDSDEPCEKVHAAAYLKCAQLHVKEPEERKTALTAQLKTAESVKRQPAERKEEIYQKNAWGR